MFLKAVDLTTALRPSLVQDETLLFVQHGVGLYDGKCKIPEYQDGQAYLTSHRLVYVDGKEPRKFSAAVDLKDVGRIEYQPGFLRSSPKIVVYPKPLKRGACRSHDPGVGAPVSQTASSSSSSNVNAPPSTNNAIPGARGGVAPVGSAAATWVCPICSFSNPIPSNFDPTSANASFPVPPCLACGIKPPFTTLLKAAIASAARRGTNDRASSQIDAGDENQMDRGESDSGNNARSNLPTVSSPEIGCPRCTFANHASLLTCEMCGAPLNASAYPRPVERTESPAPSGVVSRVVNSEIYDNIKLSFRAGGDKTFHDRLNSALIQRKWLLHGAPPVPKLPRPATPNDSGPAASNSDPGEQSSLPAAVGIAGLERRGFETRKNNEVVLGNAFEDLEALMASAKEVIALAETFATESGMTSNGGSAEADAVLSESATALGMVTTKDMLGSGTGSEDLYLSELARNLAEYLTDDRKGILHREGGIMSLIDLWAVFNRSRNGVELVSPSDFQKAAELWEKLRLPVRLRRFKSGLLVAQRFDWNDEKTIHQLEVWLDELRCGPPNDDATCDWALYGKGVTAQETAQRFGWSVGVAAEELEMAEDRGVLCREEGIEGLRFWRNYIVDADGGKDMATSTEESFAMLTI